MKTGLTRDGAGLWIEALGQRARPLLSLRTTWMK